MAEVEDKAVAVIEARATITFNEIELRALEAMTGYGVEPFLKVFYEKLGKHYMRPHEAGLRSIFQTINPPVHEAIGKVDRVRKLLLDAAKREAESADSK